MNLYDRKLIPFFILIIALLMLVIGWLGFSFIDEKEERREERELQAKEFTYQNSLIRTQADSMGRLVSTLRVTEVSREQAQGMVVVKDNFIKTTLLQLAASAKEQKHLTDNLSKAVANVKQVTNLRIESNADVLTILKDTVLDSQVVQHFRDSTVIDSLKVFARTFSFREPGGWFKVSGLVTQDSISINLREWREELVKADYSVPASRPKILPRFLRRKETITKVKSLNPYSSLRDFQQIDVSKK